MGFGAGLPDLSWYNIPKRGKIYQKHKIGIPNGHTIYLPNRHKIDKMVI
jgi:hypothetical protein